MSISKQTSSTNKTNILIAILNYFSTISFHNYLYTVTQESINCSWDNTDMISVLINYVWLDKVHTVKQHIHWSLFNITAS